MSLDYRSDLTEDLSKILTKALMKPAYLEPFANGYNPIISLGEDLEPLPISPFDPEYMPELIVDLDVFIQSYTNSEMYRNLMEGKRTLEAEFLGVEARANFIKTINQFSQLMENVEMFFGICMDPIMLVMLEQKYDFEVIEQLLYRFAKVNAILDIEIVPCIRTILFTEIDLRDETYTGYSYSKSESLSFQVSNLFQRYYDILNNINDMHIEEED